VRLLAVSVRLLAMSVRLLAVSVRLLAVSVRLLAVSVRLLASSCCQFLIICKCYRLLSDIVSHSQIMDEIDNQTLITGIKLCLLCRCKLGSPLKNNV